MEQHLNLAALASVYGKSATTIKAWASRGCPCVCRGAHGKQWAFDLAAVIHWREDQLTDRAENEDISEARRRRACAEASLAELTLNREQGLVVDRAEAISDMCDIAANMRAKLLAIPTKCAPQCHGSASVAVCFGILKKAVNEALTEISIEPLPTGDKE